MHNKTRSQRDMSHAVLYSTGPWMLRDAFKAFTGEEGELAVGYAGEHAVKGTHIMVYALGQWCASTLHSRLLICYYFAHLQISLSGISRNYLNRVLYTFPEDLLTGVLQH